MGAPPQVTATSPAGAFTTITSVLHTVLFNRLPALSSGIFDVPPPQLPRAATTGAAYDVTPASPPSELRTEVLVRARSSPAPKRRCSLGRFATGARSSPHWLPLRRRDPGLTSKRDSADVAR